MKNTAEIVNEYIKLHLDEEFDRVQNYDYISLKLIPDIELCENEWKILKDFSKTPSNSHIISHFHLSKALANRKGELCPYFGWEEIKSDKKKFERLLRNRCTYNDSFVKHGIPSPIPLHIYAQGMQVMRWSHEVSYFKPALARDLIDKYLHDAETIFDPFSGYSGRMLGALACGKTYIGQDLCEYSIMESQAIYEWLCSIDKNIPECYIETADSEEATSNGFDALFTCPPYEDIESWPEVNGNVHTCDEWIDICLERNKCNRYLFVVDDTIVKWKDNIVDVIENKSHFGTNKEFVVLI